MDWHPVPTLAWRDPRCTELPAEAFGVLLRLYGRARETACETLRVPGLSPVALVAHVAGVSGASASDALGTLQERGLVDSDGEGVILALGWPLSSARSQAPARGPEDLASASLPSRPENEPVRAMRKRVAALFAHQGLRTQEERLAWIASPEGAQVLRRRRIDPDTARSVATNEPLRPGHDPRTPRVTSVSDPSDTSDTTIGHDVSDPLGHVVSPGVGHGVSEPVGHDLGHGSDTSSRARASEEWRGEEKRGEHTHTPDARVSDTDTDTSDTSDTSDTDTKVGHGHVVSLSSVEHLGAQGLDADEVVDVLRKRAGGKVLLTYDSHTLVTLKGILGDLHRLGQVSRARVELLADWIAAGGLSWRTTGKPGVLYLCKPGILAQHLGEAAEWEADGRRPIQRRGTAGAAPARSADDAPSADPAAAGDDAPDPWASVPDVTEQRLQRERAKRSAVGAMEVSDVG
jgi:hypothetical protein